MRSIVFVAQHGAQLLRSALCWPHPPEALPQQLRQAAVPVGDMAVATDATPHAQRCKRLQGKDT